MFFVQNIILLAVMVFFMPLFEFYRDRDLNLDSLEQFASIIGSCSIGVAVAAYFYKKNQDRVIAAIDQISFFRREIIMANEKFFQDIRNEKKNEKFILPRMTLDEPTIKYAREKHPETFKDQAELIKNQKYLSRQNNILNLLEEFSLRIIHHRTLDNPALDSVKNPFVELVETHAAALLYTREIGTGRPTYSNILRIYEAWKDIADRRTPEQRNEEIMKNL